MNESAAGTERPALMDRGHSRARACWSNTRTHLFMSWEHCMFGTGVCECVYRVKHFLTIGESQWASGKLISGAIATKCIFHVTDQNRLSMRLPVSKICLAVRSVWRCGFSSCCNNVANFHLVSGVFKPQHLYQGQANEHTHTYNMYMYGNELPRCR